MNQQPSTLLYPHRYAVGIFVLDELYGVRIYGQIIQTA